MNENQITDDLLDELQELESSAEEMETNLELSKQKKADLDQLDSASDIDASSLALQAAKTAQEAATNSQKAAEASLHHADRQKEQVMELSDANFAWRNAVGSANKQIRKAKTHFAIMLVTTVVLSLAAMSVMGWLLYSMQKKEDQFKGEILDIIQTENALLSKHITLKVDELAALIELMTADIQKINQLGERIQANTEKMPVESGSTPVDTGTSMKPEAPLLDLAEEMEGTNGQTETAPMPSQTKTESTPTDKPMSEPKEMKPSAKAIPDMPMAPGIVPPSAAWSEQAHAELKALIESIIKEQKMLQTSASSAKTISHTGAAGLTEKQAKQLKDIGWLVRKQGKTIESIKKALADKTAITTSSKPSAAQRDTQHSFKAIQGSLIELKDQLKQLQVQQNTLKKQVDGLQAETKKLADAQKPYSYRFKE